MTVYNLTRQTNPSQLSIVFSKPTQDGSSGQMTVDMAIVGGAPSPTVAVKLMAYDQTKAIPIADGLDIQGNPVSSLSVSLASGWPASGHSITAKWSDANGEEKTHVLSTTIKPIDIPRGTSAFVLSIDFDFNGKKSGDPKIKVIRPPS